MEVKDKSKIVKPQEGGQDRFVRSNVDVCFFGGTLNPQPIDSLIATPNGFITMGNVKTSDVVYDEHGKEQIVNIVIDKGQLACVEFEIYGGITVQGALTHRWVVRDIYNNTLDLSGENIIERIDNGHNLFIPISSPDNLFKNEYFKLNSYKLIGNKHCKCINVSGEEHLYLTNNYVITRNCGKSSGAVLAVAEWSKIPEFRAVFTRNNLHQAKAGGGLVDEFQKLYGNIVSVKMADSPRVTFKNSKSFVDVTHISDEDPKKLMERVKGWQYDLVYLDELTGYEWSTFNIIITRNRGSAGIGSKIRGTTNPEKNHWLRKFLNDYIDLEGYIKPDWDGRVRYFYIYGETVDDIEWGDTKEEVYKKCRVSIDRILNRINRGRVKFTYENLIKSFCFYLGSMSENLASIENNKDYVGSVAASGGKRGQVLLEGNWNVSMQEETNVPIPSIYASQVANNDPQKNGDLWITCDLADEGTDNLIMIAWDGFHMFDIYIRNTSSPRENSMLIKQFSLQHNISHSNIIYDGVNGRYIYDDIPDAIPYKGGMKVPNDAHEKLIAYNLKSACFHRLSNIIKRGEFSMSEKVANKIYEHVKIKNPITVLTEFVEECSVVRFKHLSGRKRLLTKPEMNAMLGKGRSMDLLDPCAMRMMPILHIIPGEELYKTSVYKHEENNLLNISFDIYDNSNWC